MKSCRFLVFLALIIGLMAGPWQAPAEAAGLLGRVGQIKNLAYVSGTWYDLLPNGTYPIFSLASGQSFIMTQVSARFYATTADTGPYRFQLMANSARVYVANLTDVTYPTTGATVYGGAVLETIDPGIVFSVLPSVVVRHLLQPPADPNSGDIVPGTFYMTIRGYIVP